MKSVDFRNDPMFLRNQFARDGTFEMPVIKKTKLNLDNIELIGYDKLNEEQTSKIVHFFLDDYKFEVLWKDPEPHIERLREYRAILSPPVQHVYGNARSCADLSNIQKSLVWGILPVKRFESDSLPGLGGSRYLLVQF